MSTADGTDLDIECTQLYSLQLEEKVLDLKAELEQQLAEGLCDGGPGVAQVSAASKAFASLGSQVQNERFFFTEHLKIVSLVK